MTVDNYEELWDKVLSQVKLEVSSASFKTWLEPTCAISNNNNVLQVAVPNKITKDWLQQKYNNILLKAVIKFNPEIKSIEYVIKKTSNKEEGNKKDDLKENKNVSTLPINGAFKVSEYDNLNPKYTFETFVVGKFNQLAHAAAQAVISNPGLTYNPLFIYGSTGHGKTHLIQAVGNYLKNNVSGFKVYYVTSEKFTSDYINSVRAGRADAFKKKYRQYDLLIMDDIQFIADKEGTQEELFHLFNALYDYNKQIVFSSDKHPNQIPGFEERLKSRFSAGMIVEIPAPDLESRMVILKNKAKQINLDLDDSDIELIAKNVIGNIRELEGVLNIILIQQQVKSNKLNKSEILELIKQNSKPKKMIEPDFVMEQVASFYNIDKEDLKKKTRKKEIVLPRQILMYILREYLDMSYPSIGEFLGGKDHTTVMHSCEKIKKATKEDKKLEMEIEQIKDIIQNY